MMRHEDVVGSDALSQLFEIIIAQFSRRHLNAHLMQGSVCERVEMHTMERNSLPFTQLLTEHFVPVCLISTQMEIAMHRLDIIAQILADEQEADGVGSA